MTTDSDDFISKQLPRKNFILAALLVAVVFAVFSPALDGEFLWDDGFNFEDNLRYRGLGLTQLKWMFTSFHSAHYIPLSWLSLGLDYTLWGMNPFGYHLTNILLHSVSAVLFFFLSKRLIKLCLPQTGESALDGGAFFAALIFAVHPLRVESVSWITERRDVLSCVFILSSAIFYLRYAATSLKSERIKSLLCFGLAALARESVAPFSIALLALDVYPLKRLPLNPLHWFSAERRAVLIEKLPFIAISVFAGIMAIAATQHENCFNEIATAPFGKRFGFAVYGLAFYLRKTLWPFGLSAAYAIPPNLGISSPQVLRSLAFLAAAAIVSWKFIRRFPSLGTSLAVYVLFVFPTLGIATTFSIAYDRFSYFSCMGFAVMAGGGIVLLRQNSSAALKTLWTTAAAGLAALLCLLSYAQAHTWQTSVALWENALTAEKDNRSDSFILLNLGGSYMVGKMYGKAVENFGMAKDFEAGGTKVHINIARSLIGIRDYDSAIEKLNFVLREKFDSSEYLSLRGDAYYYKGDYKKALADYTLAVKYQPSAPFYRLVRANTLRKLGNCADAAAEYKTVLKVMPTDREALRGLELCGERK